MSIKDWPEGERPREKLLRHGAMALSDAELLAIFLRTGAPGVSAVELARQLLQQFGDLHAMLGADLDTFCAGKGLGQAKYTQLQAVMEMSRRYFAETLKREGVMNSPEATRRFLASRLSVQAREVFAVLFLDNRHRVIVYEELFFGTIDGASVHPREVVRRALSHHAAAVILAHNHPSGIAEPSNADQAITRRLCSALELIDVRVLDHFIVGEGTPYSFAENGLI